MSFDRRARRGAGPGRRIGLGQVDDRLLDHGPDRSAGPHRRRPHPARTASTCATLPAEAHARSCAATAIAMIFQDPMMTLNPVLRIDTQMIEAILAHERRVAREARARAREALGAGRHPVARRAARRLSAPVLRRHAPARRDRHRAAATGPTCIIADEPTTALDVTIQGQILLRDAEARARDRHGADLDHARPVGDRRPRRRRLRDVRGAHRRAGQRRRRCSTRRAIPTRAACSTRCRAATRARRAAARRFPGMTPSLLDLPPGCAVPRALRRARRPRLPRSTPGVDARPTPGALHASAAVHPLRRMTARDQPRR